MILHNHNHDHHDEPARDGGRPGIVLRYAVAAVLIAGAALAACTVMVNAGQAVVITRFGDLVRVVTAPGLAWKAPTPLESTIPVDLRLRTTSTGQQDVGTKDGLRILLQAYIAWQVPPDPDEAARQLRSLAGAALQVTASSFELADLVNTDATHLKLDEFEKKLSDQIARQSLQVYGIQIRQAGIERLSLPEATLTATVARMRAERETVAAQRTAEGLRAAAEIRSAATRDSRITVARAQTEAAEIEAASRQQAAAIQARAYTADPALYSLLRSMDTLSSVVGANTRVILRTDAAPFNLLVQGPPVQKTP
jgi:membrane protease subunit HflC